MDRLLTESHSGTLYVVASPIGHAQDLSPRALDGRGQEWGGGLTDDKLYLANPAGPGSETMVEKILSKSHFRKLWK